MKSTLKKSTYILLPIVFAVAAYFFAAFCYLEINPAKWDIGTRFLVYSGFILGLLGGIAAAKEINEN